MTHRPLLLINLLASIPGACWMLATRRYGRAVLSLCLCLCFAFVWPLPPVPALVSLVIALSLRRSNARSSS